MGHFKTFLLGAVAAYAVYYLSRKREEDGRSMLDDLLDDPSHFLNKAKDYAVDEAIRTVKQKIA
jgi:hypothetical protein